VNLYFECKTVNIEISSIISAVDSLNIENYQFDDIFEINYLNNTFIWKTKDYQLLEETLTEYKSNTDIPSDIGQFEGHEGIIYQFTYPQKGKSLNIKDSIENIIIWLKFPSDSLPLKYEETKPDDYPEHEEIYDFTKVYSEGFTRIDIIRDGSYNRRVINSQAGIEEIDGTVLMPSEEFSFYRSLGIRNDGKTKNGHLIGNGICNSTTTIFRSALHAGLPITERSGHSVYVESYEWSGAHDYEFNIVDSSFWNNHNQFVDLKFVNDLDYPIIIKSYVYRDGSNYQYHTVRILTDPKAQDRNVELVDWKKWNERSDKLFYGSFIRNVYQDDKLIRTDEFKDYFVDLY